MKLSRGCTVGKLAQLERKVILSASRSRAIKSVKAALVANSRRRMSTKNIAAASCNLPGCGNKFKSATALEECEQRHRSDPTILQRYACNQCSYSVQLDRRYEKTTSYAVNLILMITVYDLRVHF